MTPDDPRHGTVTGHWRHIQDGETACDPCRSAKTRYEKVRSVYGPRKVPAVGTRRRIQALMAMGHSGADIGRAMGVTYQAVHKLETGTSDTMTVATVERVAAVYEQLSMTIPTGYHRRRVHNKAAARGYAPPLAWDDSTIEDPNAQPVGVGFQEVDRGTLLAELDELHYGITETCKRLDLARESLERWTERHGCRDIYVRMVERENQRYWRNGGAEGGVA